MAPTLRDKHSAQTRRALIRAATSLFGRQGYESTGVDEIAAKAGATRGAVYHHFKGKRELLLAVLDELQAALARRVVAAAAREPDAWRRLEACASEFLDACTQKETVRILLEDAPAVLGWSTWREVDAKHFLGLTTDALRQLMQAGAMRDADPETVAHLLMALLTESAMLLVRSNTAEDRARVQQSLSTFLKGLRASAPAP